MKALGDRRVDAGPRSLVYMFDADYGAPDTGYES